MEAHRGQENIGFKSMQDTWSDIWTTLVIIGSTDYAPFLFFFFCAKFADYIVEIEVSDTNVVIERHDLSEGFR